MQNRMNRSTLLSIAVSALTLALIAGITIKKLLITLLAGFTLALPQVALAHEEAQKKAAVAAGPGMIARTARAGEYEVMLKHPALEPLHEHPARVFVTRYATNEPVKDATIMLLLAGKAGSPIRVAAKPSAQPGEYEVKLPSVDAGAYTLTAEVTIGEAKGTANFGAVQVEDEKPQATSESGAIPSGSWLWLPSLLLVVAASASVFFAWRRRVVLQLEG